MEEVKLHLEKAHQKLRAAEVLLNSKLYADVVSRAYYAMFHAAKAVLLLKGVKPRTHVGVIKEFGLEFVSEGYVDELLGKSFSAARENREFADYDIHVKITEEEAKETLNNAKSFVEVVERLIEKLETERHGAEK